MWILLTILAVLLFLLSMPVTLTAAYDNEIHLKLQYLFVKVGILPSQADAKKEKKEKKPKKEKKVDASAEQTKKKNNVIKMKNKIKTMKNMKNKKKKKYINNNKK